jgi:arginase family enzyme
MQIRKIDFEDIYRDQSWYQKHGTYVKSLGLGIAGGVNGYCSIEAQKKLKQALAAAHMPALTFLGSGNYHYLSYFLFQQIQQPFSLVLFDFHSDMQAGSGENLLSCGNWVSFALRAYPNLKQVFVCGISEHYIPNVTLIDSKPIYFFKQDALHSNAWLTAFDRLSRYPLYVSIDKDVFDTDTARTNWDQGSMKQDTIQIFFDLIYQKKVLIGGDVCGECSLDYSDAFYTENQNRNNEINDCLINCFLEHYPYVNERKIG